MAVPREAFGQGHILGSQLSRVYVLGCFAQRVTVYSQQVRALNLIHSLFAQGELRDGSSVAIIGGGVAGLTAGASAAFHGAKVLVLERAGVLLPLLKASTRWLYPHIAEWPRKNWHQKEARLPPFFTWSAGTAHYVAGLMDANWQKLKKDFSIRDVPQASDVQIHLPGNNLPYLTWNSPDGPDSGEFDTVILAVGFGIEKGSDKECFVSYWHGDNFDQYQYVVPSFGQPSDFLISGSGDGALIDLLRIRIWNFNQKILTPLLLGDRSLHSLTIKLLEYEEEAESADGHWLQSKYSDLPAEVVDNRLKECLRTDTSITLNGEGLWYLSKHASILNRFLVSRLMKVDPVGSPRLSPYKQ